MLQHLFAVMNELLDDIMIHYNHADDTQLSRMQEQLDALQAMSDSIVDGWLQVEEKLAYLRQAVQEDPQDETSTANMTTGKQPKQHAGEDDPDWLADVEAEKRPPEAAERSMLAGQGYFKLLMFKEAASEFRRTIRVWPDSVRARLYLAMSHMHLQEWEEAQRHCQLIVRWTSYPKWKALGLNALGCIHAVRANLEQAERYFRQAHEADPTFTGAERNLSSCKAKTKAGHLSLYFGSSELSCM